MNLQGIQQFKTVKLGSKIKELAEN